jgi:hypothetical protein
MIFSTKFICQNKILTSNQIKTIKVSSNKLFLKPSFSNGVEKLCRLLLKTKREALKLRFSQNNEIIVTQNIKKIMVQSLNFDQVYITGTYIHNS